MTTNMRIAIGAGLASVLLLAGCSGSSSGSGSTGAEGSSAAPTSSSPSSSASSSSSSSRGTPSDVIKSSLEAARTAKTVHISGTGKDSGQTVALDLHYGSNGTAGSISMGGTKISVVLLGSTIYFKAPDSFYRKQAGANAAAVLKLVSGKWVKAPSSSSTGSGFKQLADRKALIDSFASGFDQAAAASIKQTGSSSVGGVATTTYSDDSQKGTIDVAASGTPYPMKLVSKSTTDGGTLIFTDWNKPYTVSAPPAGQTVKLPGS